MTYRAYSAPRGSVDIVPLEKDRLLYKEFDTLDGALAWARHANAGGRVTLLIGATTVRGSAGRKSPARSTMARLRRAERARSLARASIRDRIAWAAEAARGRQIERGRSADDLLPTGAGESGDVVPVLCHDVPVHHRFGASGGARVDDVGAADRERAADDYPEYHAH
jgi:hypothetical protein